VHFLAIKIAGKTGINVSLFFVRILFFDKLFFKNDDMD